MVNKYNIELLRKSLKLLKQAFGNQKYPNVSEKYEIE